MLNFIKLELNDINGIHDMSVMASEIVKAHYDSVIGPEMNDYMIKMFQSEKAISEQLSHAYNYFFVKDENNRNIGFMAYYFRGLDELYLSKFYLYSSSRGKGYAKEMLSFLKKRAKESSKTKITLNCNRGNPTLAVYDKLGFVITGTEDNEIGNGFIMDDYVLCLEI